MGRRNRNKRKTRVATGKPVAPRKEKKPVTSQSSSSDEDDSPQERRTRVLPPRSAKKIKVDDGGGMTRLTRSSYNKLPEPNNQKDLNVVNCKVLIMKLPGDDEVEHEVSTSNKTLVNSPSCHIDDSSEFEDDEVHVVTLAENKEFLRFRIRQSVTDMSLRRSGTCFNLDSMVRHVKDGRYVVTLESEKDGKKVSTTISMIMHSVNCCSNDVLNAEEFYFNDYLSTLTSTRKYFEALQLGSAKLPNIKISFLCGRVFFFLTGRCLWADLAQLCKTTQFDEEDLDNAFFALGGFVYTFKNATTIGSLFREEFLGSENDRMEPAQFLLYHLATYHISVYSTLYAKIDYPEVPPLVDAVENSVTSRDCPLCRKTLFNVRANDPSKLLSKCVLPYFQEHDLPLDATNAYLRLIATQSGDDPILQIPNIIPTSLDMNMLFGK